MATPFADDGALDLESADRLVEFYLEEGVHGFTLLGVMGEAPKISLEEQAAFTDHVLKRIDGRVPVIVGVSNPGIDNLASLSKSAMDMGAGGVMVAGMPGLKTDEQVETYFRTVGDRLGAEIPICMQDYPPTTTVFLSVPVVNRLIGALPQLRMFKHEDCPGHRKLTRLREAPETEGVRRVSILTGNNGLYVPQELARGADGIMTGFAFTGTLVEVFDLFESGRAEEAEDLFDLYLPVLRHEAQFGFGLALRKEVLHRRGAIASARARDPGPAMDTRDHAELDALLDRLRAKLAAAGRSLPIGL
ncbi:MAG: dihydrodipicolinate synthase family protein [Alphaproteobacteria bacterium]|nr:dihydrodipicolinate synthase family protein [Alphaproteobacteria bacterium]